MVGWTAQVGANRERPTTTALNEPGTEAAARVRTSIGTIRLDLSFNGRSLGRSIRRRRR
jgi:hypothetical protein